MPTPDLSSLRRAVQLRDQCRTAAVTASHRVGVPMSPAQANVAFDAMVDVIREHDRQAQAEPALALVERDHLVPRCPAGDPWCDTGQSTCSRCALDRAQFAGQ